MTLQMGDSGGQDRGGAGMREGGSGNIPKVQLPRSADMDGRGIEDDLQGCGQGARKMASNVAAGTHRGRAH